MLYKAAKIVNLILWGILFLAFAFARVYQLDVVPIEIQIAGIGIFQILAVIGSFIGVATAAILVFGKDEVEQE